MGIRNLNRFLLDNVSHHSIRKIGLKDIESKIVAIDTSIYLYKFIEKNALIENMYLMITIFKKYNIIPVFIFDGKPPKEKKELLEKRRLEKKEAEEKFNQLKIQLNTENENNDDIIAEMETLKKKFVRLKETDISCVKKLMDACGIHYFESCGEADQLCAYLVKYNYVWACISDDMDMFLYGCPRVLRHLSLLNHTAIFYETKDILNDLDMTQNEFNQVLILSGTDYNLKNTKSLSEMINLFKKYKSQISHYNFYSWLINKEGYSYEYVQNLNNIIMMFDLTMFILFNTDEIRNIISVMPFRNKNVDQTLLTNILTEDGFVYIQ